MKNFARSIEGLRNDQNMPALMRRAVHETVRICLSTSVMIERFTECDFTIRESGLSNEPFLRTGVLLSPEASHEW